MASIKRRTTANGTRFDVRWRATPESKEQWKTFPTLEAAKSYRANIEADMARGTVFDPRAGRKLFRAYAEDWLDGRRLGQMTRDTYADVLTRHVYPTFGDLPLNKITPELVRRWNRPLADRIPSTAAKAYRTMKAILATAVEDQLISRNPCSIRGAGQDPTTDRTFVPADVVFALADAAHPRLTAMILVAGFGGLRYGELRAIRIRHYDRLRGSVTIEEAIDKRGRRKDPKTAASRREVALPRFVLDVLDQHLLRFVGGDPAGPLFPGEAGGVISDGWFKKHWTAAREEVGVTNVRFHDLRHTAGTLATQNGATLKEVMSRLGHSTTAAAIRYQRAADERDREVANRLDDVFGARVLEVPSRHPLAPPARYPRDESEPSQGFPEEESPETALFRAFREYPQRDSNPCRHLERVVSWATRRWGPGRRSRWAPPDLQMCLSSERRTRTPNNWTRTSCVANYTISEGWSRPVAECAPKSIESVARASSASEPVTASRTDR